MVAEDSLSDISILVTGGAGFIGSYVVDRLLKMNNKVTVFDNMSSGRMDFISCHLDNPDFRLIEGDLMDTDATCSACRDIDLVFHIAANPDVRLGATDTRVHFDHNITATYNLLEAMRKKDVRNIAFTSTSTVYGEATIIPTPENYGPLVPISLYGASKLACEALITSYSHTFDMHSWIFRFANIIGDRGTHGIIVDFIEKLCRTPQALEILGDGCQSKSYLHVHECVDAMMFAVSMSDEGVNIFNIGSEDATNPTRIAEIIVEEMGLSDVKFNYTGGSRGWKGDVPKMMLGIDKLKGMGWKNKWESERSVRETVKSLLGKKDTKEI
ncbi:NAD-dependent epimerase/dehydratase family protein [Methanolobus sp. WCC5]|uniref:NAD-dependent epimerase/dehydratase family protein n=1 Tax=Methanolobus sp. WCC5 TaxID=3125785 RepID=UPI003243BC00